VSASHAVDAEVRLFDHLFAVENPQDTSEGETWTDFINPNSMIVKNAKLEPSLKGATPESRYQFMRLGYFCLDSKDSSPENLVFNRTVELKDTWGKIQKKS
jgi:glutaminyl-tRNA synthetase